MYSLFLIYLKSNDSFLNYSKIDCKIILRQFFSLPIEKIYTYYYRTAARPKLPCIPVYKLLFINRLEKLYRNVIFDCDRIKRISVKLCLRQ